MKIPDIDQSLSLTWRFGVGYAVIAGPTLWVASPWTWDLPMAAKVAGFIVLPAVTLILLFFPALFVASLCKNFSRQKQMLIRLIAAVGVFFVSVFLAVMLLDFGPASSVVGSIAAMIVYYLLHPTEKSSANRATKPMSPSRAGPP